MQEAAAAGACLRLAHGAQGAGVGPAGWAFGPAGLAGGFFFFKSVSRAEKHRKENLNELQNS